MKVFIYAHDLGLTDNNDDRLATVDEYMQADRCVGSVFEALQPGQAVILAEGEFQLDKDLDPMIDERYSSIPYPFDKVVIVLPANPDQMGISYDDNVVAGHQRKDAKGYRFCLLIGGEEVAYQRFQGVEELEKISLQNIFKKWQGTIA